MNQTQEDGPSAVPVSREERQPDQPNRQQHTMVVGIGASAGGVEALQTFFEAIAPDLGVAYVVILHLHPEYRSEMAAILSNRTSMPVIQVTETVPLQPNHVYREHPKPGAKLSEQHIYYYMSGDSLQQVE